jgi:hypothetical protein
MSILRSHLLLCLPSSLFLWDFPTKIQHTHFLSPKLATCPTLLTLLDLITWIILVNNTDPQAPYCVVPLVLHTFVVVGNCQQPQTYVKPEAAVTVFELLIMSGVSLETCWAIKKHWNTKFYYTVASCWLFLYHFYYDARINKRQIHRINSIWSGEICSKYILNDDSLFPYIKSCSLVDIYQRFAANC